VSETIIAAMVGAITAIITSILAAWVSYYNISKEYKTKYHMDLVSKQIDACEKLWGVLEIASKKGGADKLISESDKGTFISIEAARKLHSNLTEIFNSPSGLYYSRSLRSELFILRDFIDNQILKDIQETKLQWSKAKANKLDGYIQNLRTAIREEMGLDDLRVSKLNRPN
jgi:hypothetical protein